MVKAEVFFFSEVWTLSGEGDFLSRAGGKLEFLCKLASLLGDLFGVSFLVIS